MGVVRTFGERGFVRLAALPTISNTMARLADARLPPSVLRRLIKGYIRAYRVDMSEVAEPIESFPTFNHFFTRRLRDGARPVAARGRSRRLARRLHASARSAACPREGRLDQIKGRSYEIEALLGSAEDAAAFAARRARDAVPEPEHVPPRALAGGRAHRLLALHPRPPVSR